MPPTRQTSRPRHAKTPQPAGADRRAERRRALPAGAHRGRVGEPSQGAPIAHVAAGPAELGELVAAAQSGAREALERLLDEARPRLMALAMRVLGDADEAEDAVQDAMIKVWRNLGRFEGRAAFSTWLHRIAVNAALDRVRRRGSTHVVTGAAEEQHQHDSSNPSDLPVPETPERIYARAETAVVVRQAMGRLSETHGEALRLCDLEGESYATIAEVTDCPLGTVMSRLFHARRKLVRELSEVAVSEGDLEALRAA
jgi:RNA polymerase sigma-70 factor, ECF subfamily